MTGPIGRSGPVPLRMAQVAGLVLLRRAFRRRSSQPDQGAPVGILPAPAGPPAIKFQNPADLVALKSLAESGSVVPVLDVTYPLSDTPRAVGQVGAGHARGTVVITV